LLNYVNGKKDVSEWDRLTLAQKKGLMDAIDQLDSGKEISHNDLIDKLRKKYNA
jgi:hypothetical protein